MKLRILILLAFITNIVYGQNDSSTKDIAFEFIDTLIVKNKLTVSFLDFEVPQEVQDIVLRFQKAMTKRKEWFEEYSSKNYSSDEGLPYHKNFGITKEEYLTIKNMDKTPLKILVRNTSTIIKNRSKDVLTFIAEDVNAKFLELIVVDFENKLMIFNKDTLTYNSEINAPSTTPFGEWHGHSWKKEISNLGDNEEVNLDKLVSKSIEIDIGKINHNSKTLFRLKIMNVDKRKLIENIDICCYLD